MIYCFGLLSISLVMTGASLPRPGKMMTGEAYHLRPSGSATNTAVAVKRAGAPEVKLCAVIGEDEFSSKLNSYLQGQKINLEHVAVQSGGTAMIHAAVQKGGVVQNSLALGVGGMVRADTIAAELHEGDHVMMDVMANAEQSYALIKSARANGASFYLHYTHGARLPDDEVLSALSWIMTDPQGAAALAGKEFVDHGEMGEWAADYIMRHQLHLAIQISPMETHVFTFNGGFIWRGLKLDALDHSGAQEAWLGTLITALAAKLPEQRALARAAAAASLSTLALGPQDAMVQNQTLAEWLPDLPEPERIN